MLKLSKSDVRRAMVRHHFAPCASQMDAFYRLRSIQFDPLAPVGCNHDLVLQARVPAYKVRLARARLSGSADYTTAGTKWRRWSPSKDGPFVLTSIPSTAESSRRRSSRTTKKRL